MNELEEQLFGEILMARRRVYAAGQPTPLQEMEFPGLQAKVFVKREDLGPIQAYKWRGAYNRMAKLTEAEREAGVVTASAGNHAQGVARAAHLLGTKARIYMPRSTPLMKQKAVAHHGGRSPRTRKRFPQVVSMFMPTMISRSWADKAPSRMKW